ncbi:MAG: hypothetical protein HQ579_07990 [Candidatus Omnitrophica bacterium]|nr:hypothetical protein [Candidatus Omnitrophota bacterium]
MEYKTVIEIISEAKNSHDAADIAGEYLRGSLDTGVQMKSTSRPLKRYKVSRIILFVLMILSIVSVTTYKINKNLPILKIPSKNVCAIQPPLKTFTAGKELSDCLEDHRK